MRIAIYLSAILIGSSIDIEYVKEKEIVFVITGTLFMLWDLVDYIIREK